MIDEQTDRIYTKAIVEINGIGIVAFESLF